MVFFNTNIDINIESIWHGLQNNTGIGFQSIFLSELYNFPESLQPNCNKHCFIIGDEPDKANATCLIDCLNYDSTSSILLPKNGAERLEVFINAINLLVKLTQSYQV